MLTSRPSVQVSSRRNPNRPAVARPWQRGMDKDRGLADSTQRAVARGRQTIVDAHSRVLRFRHGSLEQGGAASRTAKRVHRRLAQLVQRVEGIHQRLLRLSTDVEHEIDRLDIARAEIDRLTPAGTKPGDRR
jgi:hypothetical protein